jgi:hypothetical protein
MLLGVIVTTATVGGVDPVDPFDPVDPGGWLEVGPSAVPEQADSSRSVAREQVRRRIYVLGGSSHNALRSFPAPTAIAVHRQAVAILASTDRTIARLRRPLRFSSVSANNPPRFHRTIMTRRYARQLVLPALLILPGSAAIAQSGEDENGSDRHHREVTIRPATLVNAAGVDRRPRRRRSAASPRSDRFTDRRPHSDDWLVVVRLTARVRERLER